MPTQGIAVEREQTKQYIDENPTSITLNRRTKVSDGAGGHTYTSVPVAAQVFRVIQQRQYQSLERRTVGGEMVNPDIVLMCEWDADVVEGDTFTHEGRPHEVVYVMDLNYELLAEVTAR